MHPLHSFLDKAFQESGGLTGGSFCFSGAIGEVAIFGGDESEVVVVAGELPGVLVDSFSNCAQSGAQLLAVGE